MDIILLRYYHIRYEIFDNIEHVLIFVHGDEDEKKQSKLIKLHQQFGHASSDNLKSLLENAGCSNEDISKLITEVTIK